MDDGRDNRSPVPKSEAVSRLMRANKAKGTGPEIILRRALRERGLGGYRLNWSKAPGRPDICYPGRKVAIFVHGCFWHRCPDCDLPIPRNNRDFWEGKFRRNIERDRIKESSLEEAGWTVLVVWECALSTDLETVVDGLESVIRGSDGCHYR